MKKILIFLLAVILSVSSFAFSCFSASASETEVPIEETISDNFVFENTIQLYVDGNGFVSGTEIDVVIFASLSNEIQNIEFEGNGFSLTKSFEIIDGNIYFSVINDITVDAPHLTVELELDNDELLTANLYGYICEGMIYVDPHAYFFAERAYLYYTGNTSITDDITENNSMIADDVIEQINVSEPIDVTSSAGTDDITVTGAFCWSDKNDNSHPLRFIKIKVYKDALILTTCIYEGYTDENGEFNFSFSSDLLNGSQKIAFKVYAQGADIAVQDAYNFAYKYRIDSSNDGNMNLDNITVGQNNLGVYTFAVNDMTEETDIYLCRALEIAQSAIYASTYYEEMKGTDVSDVVLIYPHRESSTLCFYRASENKIYIVEATGRLVDSYEDCDIITHEYGHHVSYCEGIIDSPGGEHYINADMAEHYKDHYEGENTRCDNECGLKAGSSTYFAFIESDCKIEGCRLAWSEGYASFFAELSQQYFSENYVDSTIDLYSILKFADTNSTTHAYTFDYSLETYAGSNYYNDSNEFVVMRLLYDIFDAGTTENFDNLTIGHQELWEYIVESDAKTLFEFIEYFYDHASAADIDDLRKILHGHHLATSAPNIPSLSPESPTIEFIWDEPNTGGFYNARKFQVNFYNASYDLICSTPRQVVTIDSFHKGTITISDELWQDVLNYGSIFYVTVTVFECDGNVNNSDEGHYITYYESPYSMYSVSNIPLTLVYNVSATNTLPVGGYRWYKFTAPMAAQYVFQSLGTTDTYGELFTAIAVGTTTANRISYDNDSGTDSNFKITYNLSKGQTVYIRVRGDDWIETGSFIISVSAPNHIHVYTHHYEKFSSSQHKAYCVCGTFDYKDHEYLKIPTGHSCKFCGYFVKDLPVILLNGSKIIGNEGYVTTKRREEGE